jgi:hypothetical protein
MAELRIAPQQACRHIAGMLLSFYEAAQPADRQGMYFAPRLSRGEMVSDT